MKTVRIIFNIICILIIQGGITELWAQSKLDAIIKVWKADSCIGKKVCGNDSSIVIKLGNNRCLLDDFIQTLKKERKKKRNQCVLIMQKEDKNGECFYESYGFYDEKNLTLRTYGYDIAVSTDIKIIYTKESGIVFPKSKTKSKIKQKTNDKLKFMIPKNGYINVNGKKMTAQQAREIGMDIEEF